MPQDTPDAISPRQSFEGRCSIPGFDMERRWLDASRLGPELRTELLELIRAGFNGYPAWFSLPVSPEDHLEWKYRDCQVGAQLTLTVEPNDRIAGFVGHTRRIWLVRGRPLVVRFGYDLCLLPEWQGRGLYRAIGACIKQEVHPSVDFTLSEWTHPADRHLARERGYWGPANEAHDYVRILRPLSKLHALTNPFRWLRGRNDQTADSSSNTTPVILARESSRLSRLRNLATLTGRFARSLLARRPAPRAESWTTTTLTHFEDQHAPFLDSALSQFDFVGERSVPYLNWRFCDERAGPFTIRVARQDDQLLDYAVTRANSDNARVADILTLPGRTDIAESLIRDAISLAQQAGSDSVEVRLPMRHPYQSALSRTGFFDRGHFAGELIEPGYAEEIDLGFLENEDASIHYTLADSDIV